MGMFRDAITKAVGEALMRDGAQYALTHGLDSVTGLPRADESVGGAKKVTTGSGGGASAVTTLSSFLVAGGATQTGIAISMPNGKNTIQAVANAQAAAAFTATVTVQVSNDNINWQTLGTITLSGTGATADVGGFVSDAPWAYVRANVANLAGTLATCIVKLGV